MRFVCSKSIILSLSFFSLTLSSCVSDYQYKQTTESQKNSNNFKTGNSPEPLPKISPTPEGTTTPTPTPSTTPVSQVDSISVPALDKTKVDMIFVVDNSGSMEDEQAIIAKNFGSFIDKFEQKDIDYRIAVITTDVVDPLADTTHWGSTIFPGYISPSRGNFLSKYSGEKWLTKNSSNLGTKFRNNVQPGISGSGREQALNSLMYALSDSKINSGGFNSGFLRSDSLLSVIVVSDEDEDIVNEDGNTPEQRLTRVENRLKAIRPTTSKGFRFDFVINLDAANPGSITYPLSTAVTNPYPNVYLKAADKFHSKKYNINADFGPDLVDIGADIVNQAQAFHKLTKTPVVSSIVVKVAGSVIAANASNGYIYHADTNSIELVGAALVSSPEKQITITYNVQ